MQSKRVTSILGPLIILAVCVSGKAQWAAVVLHPPGATSSRALAVADGQQGGWIVAGGVEQAYVWEGSAESGIHLHPAWASSSRIRGVSKGYQVGNAIVGGLSRATIWQGSARSALSIHPMGFESSGASSISGLSVGGHLVGASLEPLPAWTPHANNSWIDLTIAGRGAVHGVFESVQGGFTGAGYATMWKGTQGTYTNLHPTTASRSRVYAVYGDEQVGSADLFSEVTVACLWRGTINSRVTLGQDSNCYGVYAGQQIGEGFVNGVDRALRWVGTWPYATDLHSVLPAGYSRSAARAVWDDSELYTYVAGWARHTATACDHAVLWQAPNIRVSQVESLQVFRGQTMSGGLSSIQSSDDERIVLRPGITFTSAERPIQLIVEGNAAISSPRRVSLSTEAFASSTFVKQSVEFYDFVAQQFVPVDEASMSTQDAVIRADLSNQAGRFVEPGSGRIRSRVSYWATGPVFVFPWQVGIDRMWLHMVGID